MKLHTYLFLASLALLVLKAFGVLAVSWFLVFLPALVAVVLGFVGLLLAGAAVMAAAKSDPLSALR